jgi:N-acetylglucosamine-6-phosphate deacetylase
MSITKISVPQLFDGEKILHDKTISVDQGHIISIDECNLGEQNFSGILVPGFIDVQVNGGGGFLFNESPTVTSIKSIGIAHQQFGTTGWLPTLVTDSVEKMQQAAEAVAEARRKNIGGVLGIHFEGPHLSVAKKGVHSESFIRAISDVEMSIFTRNDLGKVVVTIAPESISTGQIKQLVANGVIVCLGHSNATFEQTNQALSAGATGFTHLFNAMSSFTSREPGMVGAALLDQQSFAGLILDGIHVHPDSARLACSVKSNIMLVTDAMPPVGTEQQTFSFFGSSIKRDGNRLTDSEGRLAGSALDMVSAVKNAQAMLSIELSDAVNLASRNPARFLGMEQQYGAIKVGAKASLVLLDQNQNVGASWIDGEKVI